MKIFKKAQAATEYLIILAVVVIIALVVVGVMGGIPGIGKGATSRASAAYWSTADIGIVDYAIDSAGAANVIKVKNNLRNSISITNLALDSTNVVTAATTVQAGDTVSLAIASHVDCGSAGDAYSYDVAITYTDSGTDANYTFDGDSTKLEGTCAS